MNPLARVSDMVRDLFATRHRFAMTPDEMDLAVSLRGNIPLYEALTNIVQSRITGRASLPVPSDPTDCKAILDRDHELRWLLSRLEFVYRSPVNQADAAGEPPAA